MSEQVLAVNAALIPKPHWINWAASIGDLLGPTENSMIFSKSCVPHVTLSMACIPLSSLRALGKAIPPMPKDMLLTPISIDPVVKDGITTWWLSIEQDEVLMEYQQKVAEVMASFAVDGLDAKAFAGEECGDKEVNYVKGFAEQTYVPHMSLGYGTALPMLPSAPNPSGVVPELWHIGPDCTCFGRLFSQKQPKPPKPPKPELF